MIKAAKRVAYVILGRVNVTVEELTTASTGAEALINIRSVMYHSANPLDDVPLTPNYFVCGQVGGQSAPEAVDSSQFSPRKRQRHLQ